MQFSAVKEDWHAYCVLEHTKKGVHPGPPPLRPNVLVPSPSPATASHTAARSATLLSSALTGSHWANAPAPSVSASTTNTTRKSTSNGMSEPLLP
jgi:hypothetical protein